MAFDPGKYEFQKALCAAIGVDPDKTHRITIDVRVDSVVVRVVESYLTKDEGVAVITLLEGVKFEPVNKPEEEAPEGDE